MSVDWTFTIDNTSPFITYLPHGTLRLGILPGAVHAQSVAQETGVSETSGALAGSRGSPTLGSIANLETTERDIRSR